MQIETERLILRDLNIKDAEDFANQGNDPEINFFNWYLPYPLSLHKAKSIISKRSIVFKGHRWLYELGLFLKETGSFIGIISLYDVSKPDNKAKLGYWIGKGYRNKGYVSEGIKRILDFAFDELSLNKVSAKSLEDNEISNKILKKMGFRLVGVSKLDKIIKNKSYNVSEWEIINPLINQI